MRYLFVISFLIFVSTTVFSLDKPNIEKEIASVEKSKYRLAPTLGKYYEIVGKSSYSNEI